MNQPLTQMRGFGTDKLCAVSMARHLSRLQLCKCGYFYVVYSFYHLFFHWI
uniref:Alternative protein C9orf100 n=1 Tax=Homo sapiens TaxID=9606 RepID=L8ECL6_HUMAN|nr:alternative protein C9orf100 [Homo sapiens]